MIKRCETNFVYFSHADTEIPPILSNLTADESISVGASTFANINLQLAAEGVTVSLMAVKISS